MYHQPNSRPPPAPFSCCKPLKIGGFALQNAAFSVLLGPSKLLGSFNSKCFTSPLGNPATCRTFPFSFCFNSLLKPQPWAHVVPITANLCSAWWVWWGWADLFILTQLASSCGSWLLAHIFLTWDAFASQPNSWNQREAEGSRLQAACTGGQVLVTWSTRALGRRQPLAFMSLPAKEYRKQMSQSTALAELIILRRLQLPPASPPLCRECKIDVCKTTPLYIYFGQKCCQGN